MKRIKLESRYASDVNYLEEVAENKYKLSTKNNYRMGFDKDPTVLTFVDPSGGPFIQKGTEIKKVGIVKDITYEPNVGPIIEFE